MSLGLETPKLNAKFKVHAKKYKEKDIANGHGLGSTIWKGCCSKFMKFLLMDFQLVKGLLVGLK